MLLDNIMFHFIVSKCSSHCSYHPTNILYKHNNVLYLVTLQVCFHSTVSISSSPLAKYLHIYCSPSFLVTETFISLLRRALPQSYRAYCISWIIFRFILFYDLFSSIRHGGWCMQQHFQDIFSRFSVFFSTTS